MYFIGISSLSGLLHCKNMVSSVASHDALNPVGIGLGSVAYLPWSWETPVLLGSSHTSSRSLSSFPHISQK
ncbi:unknown [Tannerella sp. CAG:118]|nr:unknown [Tannerella sp. CAG:118]